MIKHLIFLSFFTFLCACSGTITTTRYLPQDAPTFKKAIVVSNENSQYIKFKVGTLTPLGYRTPQDVPAQQHQVIGNTDTIIKLELEKYGIATTIGKEGNSPADFDLIVQYTDTWRWDFKPVLDQLEILFISPQGDSVLAKSSYTIYRNKELHNFPTPEKEVPKMIKELLNK